MEITIILLLCLSILLSNFGLRWTDSELSKEIILKRMSGLWFINLMAIVATVCVFCAYIERVSVL
jgi:uncharacterized membrane protein